MIYNHREPFLMWNFISHRNDTHFFLRASPTDKFDTRKIETGTVPVRRAPDKNDKPFFLRASPTDKFATRFSRESLAIPSARLRIRRLYANHMLRICETYIFAENIMSYIWLTYTARNFVEVHEDERENRQQFQLTTSSTDNGFN